ncbi:MAG: hypothetical protein VYB61_01610 [Verrucomicrobiota bacterium]|nr:hypothetical protein [Verrucomicrobiota bacterium]
MDREHSSKKNPWLIAGIPIALIGLGILISQFFKTKEAPVTKESVFSLWVTEAEIAPVEENNDRWDKDGSAPDPGALVTWQDQVVLETVVAKDSLIARWDPVAISVGDVVLSKGGISTSSVKRIARVRNAGKGNFSVALFDEDILGRDFIGGWTIPTAQLRPGLLELKSGKALRRIALAVTLDDNLDVPEQSYTPKGAVYLDSTPEVMMETMERWAEEAKEFRETVTEEAKELGETVTEKAKELGETFSKGIDRLGQEVGEGIEKLGARVGKEKDRLKKTFQETKEKAGNKVRESLEKLLPGQE